MQEELDALYDALIAALPGSSPRAGQRQMLHAIGAQLADARFEPDGPLRAAVLEAGTGVGKTRAYLAAGLLLARQKGVKLVVSTSTVALQEQVLRKDLPDLAAALEIPATMALLKGRGRYLCPVKLDAACEGEPIVQEPLDLPEPGAASPAPLSAERLNGLRRRWKSGAWDGERDSLGPEDLALWPAIGGERSSCSSRACPQFNACPYFDAKRAASKAEVLITNHDLVLSSMRSDLSSLPSGERAIYVFDEGHHLPATALSHFACEANLSERRWLQRLEKSLLAASSLLGWQGGGFDGCAAMLGQALDDVLQGLMAEHGEAAVAQLAALPADAQDGRKRTRIRLPEGRWAPELAPLWQAVEQQAQRLHDRGQELSAWMRQLRQEDESLSDVIAVQVAEIGPPFKRLGDLLELAKLTQRDDDPVPAKWLDFEASTQMGQEQLRISAKASPLFAGGVLRAQLWSRLRAVVVTSATLRALGRFDFFLREVGLADEPGVQALAVDSPFDYAAQGRFLVAETRASPRDANAHTLEVAALLAEDLKAVEHGALLLCSSWNQLRTLVGALPPSWRRSLRVQGEQARDALLREHRRAVADGERSILVGLQSFGEGLDLPGRDCEWVFLPKLPFMTPDDPVAEARAEWLQARGRNPFVELVVPATGVRLNQWAGRGIRSESDRATIVCYDPRLTQTSFGRQLLAGLPPFTRLIRRAGQKTVQPLA